MLQSVKRQREYQGYRNTGAPELTGSGSSMPILIGAAMIAAAILLSTLITALGSRYAGFESPTEETAWLVDRLSGNRLFTTMQRIADTLGNPGSHR